jgi:hypothetical protein
MKIKKLAYLSVLFLLIVFYSCSSDNSDGDSVSETEEITVADDDCTVAYELDDSRGACDQTLTETSIYEESTSDGFRLISANSIPEHKVGLFGEVQGALNPNEISEQDESYTITNTPTLASSFTALLGEDGIDYRFGILFNGVELDPIAAEPFPHEGILSENVNWEWNLEATNVDLGLDCSNAHVQPSGQYHYHGSPDLYLEDLVVETNQMTLIGYAADGFPIYYKYAYTDATDATSEVVEMTSSYQLKTGDRPGDGVTAPCGEYDGVYSADYEYVSDLGTLDEANGRTGITPEYPEGTYYYVITESFPIIPRYFKGTPSDSFSI